MTGNRSIVDFLGEYEAIFETIETAKNFRPWTLSIVSFEKEKVKNLILTSYRYINMIINIMLCDNNVLYSRP
jgi:hypothetical protein